jgi:hypothetical protein
MMQGKPRIIRVERRPPEDFSDHQIETLMNFGKREADLINEMDAAVQVGDRNLVWQLAVTLTQLHDERAQVTKAGTE